MTDLSISIESSDRWEKAFPRMADKIAEAVATTIMAAKKPAVLDTRDIEINLLLSDDAVIKKLNTTWRGKAMPTNVLSFPQLKMKGLRATDLDCFPARTPVPLGDVVLALQTIRRESKEQKKSLEDHVIHLVIHGTLHLFGYDHMNPKDAKKMESLECDIMADLGYANPYQEPTKPVKAKKAVKATKTTKAVKAAKAVKPAKAVKKAVKKKTAPKRKTKS